MSDARNKRDLARAALWESLVGKMPERPVPSRAVQQLADQLAGRPPAPKQGTAAAELAAALAGERDDKAKPIARTPSDELREVITDVLRTMHARGELPKGDE